MTAPVRTTRIDSLASQSPPVHLPDPAGTSTLAQDEEWFEVQLEREWRKIRLHDYEAIFSIPGLYEKIVYDLLDCQSPRVVRELLAEQFEATDTDATKLSVLDLGAGNGCVAEELHRLSVAKIVGLDITPEAEEAAQRDRPGIYDDYLVGDICDPDSEAARSLATRSFTCLISVAALGFGDIPPLAFAKAFNRIEQGGWIAFTIKESFLRDGEPSGFAGLVRSLLNDELIELKQKKAYPHRVSTARDPLTYVAFVGRKLRDLDETRVF